MEPACSSFARRALRASTQIQALSKEVAMLRWAMGFLVVALIAALLGYSGIAGTASNIASTLFWVFVALFILSLLVSLVSGRKTPVP
jgi:uncharacterized membrane protein YtjA (UPF0391 family)